MTFEIAENQTVKAFPGLQNFLQLKLKKQPPIYIFDNHNHAFYFWHFEKSIKNLTEYSTIIRFDQHRDSRIPASFLTPQQSRDLDQVFQYTNEILNVGNFIPAALKTGIIKKIILIDSAYSLENFRKNQLPKIKTQQPIILDIDLDFFAPELDYIDNQLKLDTIKKLLPLAATITIATSPFFIDQKLALDWCHKILQPLNL